MTAGANVIERGLIVYGNGLVVISLMAGITRRGRAAIPLAVASQAIQSDMRPGQREGGLIMVEAHLIPGGGNVTDLALVRIVLREVVWILYIDIFLFVAGITHR